MKHLLLCLLMVISISTFAQDRVIAAKELPKNAQILIKETFNFQKVIQATIDDDSRQTEYTFILADNTKVECDAEGNWKEIESRNMPASLIPATVTEFCNQNYAGIKVVKLEKENHNVLKVELSNDVDLIYHAETGKIVIDK